MLPDHIPGHKHFFISISLSNLWFHKPHLKRFLFHFNKVSTSDFIIMTLPVMQAALTVWPLFPARAQWKSKERYLLPLFLIVDLTWLAYIITHLHLTRQDAWTSISFMGFPKRQVIFCSKCNIKNPSRCSVLFCFFDFIIFRKASSIKPSIWILKNNNNTSILEIITVKHQLFKVTDSVQISLIFETIFWVVKIWLLYYCRKIKAILRNKWASHN